MGGIIYKMGDKIKKRSWYSNLTEDKKEEIRKRKKDVYALKKHQGKNPTQLQHPKEVCVSPTNPQCQMIKRRRHTNYPTTFEVGANSFLLC
ncbi:hypothetical protein CsatB_023194 [Cannabis sativa]